MKVECVIFLSEAQLGYEVELSFQVGVSSRRLKQLAKNRLAEALILSCDDISKSPKPEISQLSLFHFLPWDGAPVEGHMYQHKCWDGLTGEGAPNNRLW